MKLTKKQMQRALGGMVIISGVLILFGTVGAHELGRIGFLKAVGGAVGGLIIMFGGAGLVIS